MTSAKKLALAGLMLALALLACTLPDVGPTPVPALTPKSVDPDLIPQQTEMSADQTAEQTEGDLPHTVYFLSNNTENIFQIWRLESYNYTSYQVTYESTDILDYTVSPVDGSVAYVIGNQLYWVDADGENRKVKRLKKVFRDQ